MPFWDDIVGFLKRNQGYFLGQALLMAAVAGVSSLLSVSILWPATVIVVGKLALQAYGRFNELNYYKQQMVDLYREDIAEHLGIAPEQVSIANLKEAAKENEVIAQALERQHKKTVIEVSTALLAGAVTFGLLLSFSNAGEFFEKTKSLGKFFGDAVNFIGLSTVGTISGVLFNDVLGFAIGAKIGVNKAAAHDLIAGLDNQIRHGKPISREQVFGVLVAGNDALAHSIKTQFGKSYGWMSAAEKSNVLHMIGVALDMDELAKAINRGEVRPGRLAFMMDDASVAPRTRAREEATPAMAPARASFVERFAPATRSQGSFTERVDASRAGMSERAV